MIREVEIRAATVIDMCWCYTATGLSRKIISAIHGKQNEPVHGEGMI